MITDIFCNIEMPPVIDCRLRKKVDIHGWVIDSGNQIRRLVIRGQNGESAQCEYGKERPDVEAAYPGISNAFHSGFEAVFPMPDGLGNFEIILEAEFLDKSCRELAKKTVTLRDSAQSGVSILTSLASLKYPDEFDGARVLSAATVEPVFVVGEEGELFAATVSALQRSFESKSFPALQHFQLLADLVAVTKNTWDDEMKGYFYHLGDVIHLYGIGHLDIYEIIAEISKSFCDRYDRQVVSNVRVDGLPGEEGLRLVPFVKTLYPRAKFICLKPGESRPGAEVPAIAALWNSVKQRLDKGAYLEVEEDLVASEGKARAALLADFMGMDEAQREMLVASLCRQAGGAAPVPDSQHAQSGGADRPAAQQSVQGRQEFQLDKLSGFSDEKPIFVLGAGRSGTSAMTGVLMDGLHISGWHEGHVFPFLEQLLNKLFEKYGRSLSGSPEGSAAPAGPLLIPAIDIYDILDAVVRRVIAQCKRDPQNCQWVDKTADDRMIECVPLLLQLFPHSRFIFLRRHPIPLALSRLRKFQEPPVLSFVRWAKCIDAWEKARLLLNKGQFEEFDQKDLTQQTFAVVDRIRKIISFDDEDRTRAVAYLKYERPEFTRERLPQALFAGISDDGRRNERAALYFNFIDYDGKYLEDTDWNETDRRLFLEICGEKGKRYGYSFHRDPAIKQNFIADVAVRIESMKYNAEEKVRDITQLADDYRRLYERRTLRYWMAKVKAILMRVLGITHL